MIIEAERKDASFLVYRDSEETLRVDSVSDEFTVGRNREAELCIHWDDQVSGLHAELEQLGGELTLVDDGLSRNGSYVNGERVRGRRRLRDGDLLQFGRTVVLVRRPTGREQRATELAIRAVSAVELSARAARGPDRTLPSVVGRQLVRGPGDQPPDRRRAVPLDPRCQAPSPRAVRQIRRQRPTAERKASRACRPRASQRSGQRRRTGRLKAPTGTAAPPRPGERDRPARPLSDGVWKAAP